MMYFRKRRMRNAHTHTIEYRTQGVWFVFVLLGIHKTRPIPTSGIKQRECCKRSEVNFDSLNPSEERLLGEKRTKRSSTCF